MSHRGRRRKKYSGGKARGWGNSPRPRKKTYYKKGCLIPLISIFMILVLLFI